MKKIFVLIALLSSQSAFSQAKVSTEVYPGTELLNVVQLLADTNKGAKSTYRQDIIGYFGKYQNHAAVKMARALPFINCDFPVRLSWAFYHFPDIKLHLPDTLGGYEHRFKKQQVNDYLQACVQFYKDTRFWDFYRRYQPEYRRWTTSFNRNLYEKKMLATLDSFYRVKPAREIIITLGALNCGSYAIPDMGLFNPEFKNKTVIMVAYGSIIGNKGLADLHPDFFAPAWATQLVWHEMGHAYLAGIFEANQGGVEKLKYVFDRDTAMQNGAGKMGWPTYLNENVTQAVTSLLRIDHGANDRAAEMKRLASGGFYRLSPAIMDIIETDYDHKNIYTDFSAFFPVLLRELSKKYP